MVLPTCVGMVRMFFLVLMTLKRLPHTRGDRPLACEEERKAFISCWCPAQYLASAITGLTNSGAGLEEVHLETDTPCWQREAQERWCPGTIVGNVVFPHLDTVIYRRRTDDSGNSRR